MTVVAHPLDAVAGAPLFTAQQIRQSGSVLHGGGGGSALGGRDGFRVGTGNVVSVSGSTWRVAPCSGVLDTGAVVTGDPYEWAVTAQESGTIAAADANNPRVDVVYVRIADNAVDSAGVASAFVEYKAGVPASSPVPPTTMVDGATPLTRGFVLGTIQVPAAGGGNPSPATTRQFVVAAGGRLPIGLQAEQDALTPYEGLGVTRTDLHQNLDYLNGSWVVSTDTTAWLAYTPAWTAPGSNPSVGTGGNAGVVGRYKIRGKTMHFAIVVTIGTSGATGGSGIWRFSLPSGVTSGSIMQAVVGQLRASSGRFPLTLVVGAAGTFATDGTFGNGAALGDTTALAAGNQIVITGAIEIA